MTSRTASGRDALRSLLEPNRPQQILTPEYLLNLVRAMMGGAITLDPCAATGEPPIAMINFMEATNGLIHPWCDRTFVNPPFKHLKLWLHKAVVESVDGGRIVVLCPVRSRSGWWRDARNACKRDGGTVVELDRVTFVGYSATFPESCVLMCFNTPQDVVERALEKFPFGEISL